MSTVQYKKEYCQMLIDHMSDGYSFSSFGSVVNCGRQTLYDWVERHPEFAEAKKAAMEKAKYFYESILISHARGSKINNTEINFKQSNIGAAIFALKTRFHDEYSEKKEHSLSQDTAEVIKLCYKLDE